MGKAFGHDNRGGGGPGGDRSREGGDRPRFPRTGFGGAGGPGGPRGGPAGGFERRRPPVSRTLRIIHEDDDLIVVDKPPGIVTANMGLAAAGDTGARSTAARESIFDMVKDHVKFSRRKRGEGRVWIIHRLDKEASGLLVFAKSERAFAWLKEDFRAKRVHRLYTAVVEGEIEMAAQGATAQNTPGDAPTPTRSRQKQLPAGTIQSFILEGAEGESARSMGLGEVARGSVPPPRPPVRADEGRGARGGRIGRGSARFAGDEGAGEARLAITHYRVLAMGRGRSLLQLRLETGRKNQIRVHMQEFGRPIVGDRRYGAATDPVGRLCLHASELGFTHHQTGQALRFSSPAPAAFYGLVGMDPPAASQQASDERRGAAAQVHPAAATTAPLPETSWDSVAEWYDALVEEEKSDHFQDVIMPGALRLLRPARGMRILDVACGQGALARQIAQLDAEVVGIDASPRLIASAKKRTEEMGLRAAFEVGDARELASMQEMLGAAERPFDAIVCSMALMNLDPLEPVIRGCAAVLKRGGVLVAVILHPAFRSPRQTSWGWAADEPQQTPRPDDTPGKRTARGGGGRDGRGGPPAARVHQYRRVDGYLSPGQVPITMNPGYAAHGAEEVTTWTFHRPLQTYIRTLGEAGFLLEALEEWPSLRKSQSGPRAAEENRARREIPMFLALRAVRCAE
jgi:23S rRNA-/tRNA-specific pseudouridylate synthase/ubiquinone/menaquinone biosynthesis C-methylase UbiE